MAGRAHPCFLPLRAHSRRVCIGSARPSTQATHCQAWHFVLRAAKVGTEGCFDAFHATTMCVSLAVRLDSAPLRALACCILGLIAGKVALRAGARPLYLRGLDVMNAVQAVLIAWCDDCCVMASTLTCITLVANHTVEFKSGPNAGCAHLIPPAKPT